MVNWVEGLRLQLIASKFQVMTFARTKNNAICIYVQQIGPQFNFSVNLFVILASALNVHYILD